MKDRYRNFRRPLPKSVDDLVLRQQSLQNGLSFWSQNLLSEDKVQKYRTQLDETKTFLESLQAYTSPGRLKNFRYTAEDVHNHREGLDSAKEIESLQELVADIGPIASYLSTAEAVLPADHEWVSEMKKVRKDALLQLDDIENSDLFRQQIRHKLTVLKTNYIQTYLGLHTKARLGVNEDKRKVELTNDERLQMLKNLSSIELMPLQHLTDFQERLGRIKELFCSNRTRTTHCLCLPTL